MALTNFEILRNSIDLSLQRGDSSVYDVEKLRNNELFQEFGLGSLLSIGAMPIISEPDNVKPLVTPTIGIREFELFSDIEVPFHLGYDDNIWVVLFGAKKVKIKIPGNNNSQADALISTILNSEQAFERYKKLNIHLGKYSSLSQAQIALEFFKNAFNTVASFIVNGATQRQFGKYVTSLNVSYSIDGANEIKFTVIDKNYQMMENNFFMARRRIRYRNDNYEIGAVEVGPGPGGSPMVTVTAWNESVQRMKRDKKPELISGSSVYEYAFNVAKKFGLLFVGEKTNKQQTINKGNGNNSDESVWSVLQSAANQEEFVLYVMDGTMVYGSQKWLLWKFGTDSYEYTNPTTKKKTTRKYSRLYFDPNGELPQDARKFKVAEWPSIRQSENDPLEGDGSVVVQKPNGCIIRPGGTVIIGPKPTLFKGGYLVTEVSFSEGTSEPVTISFRTPEKPSKQTDTE